MFRKLGKSKIAFVLAILFGISLFLFRGSCKYSNLFNSDNVIASVSGTPISTTKFNRVMNMNISQYSQMLGKELNSDEIKALQIHICPSCLDLNPYFSYTSCFSVRVWASPPNTSPLSSA